ncbi:hypothetical protein K474DRAFT_1287592 [Panus rudis PR-1116 ss-1]|nr:hypothetical protein K474DRAFT_1287592 [Panus rudis PR-1116 ss-1]
MFSIALFASVFILLQLSAPVHSHASIWHPSMWGFNVTAQTYGSDDNRPVSPLVDMTFERWWFHGHLDHPPHKEDVFELPAGQTVTTEIACNKGATSYFASSEGGDIRSGNDPCPGSPPSEYHTTGPDDLKGCSLAIAYKSDVTQVQPEDFTVFSVNHSCVFYRFTDFQVPKRMPPCPPGGCICAWFWIHSADSGSEQNYMNGFQCNVTGSTSNVALAKPQVPRRCGADPDNGKPEAAPGNCTYGAKQPFYWFQKERNNMFEGAHAPPYYLDLYNFKDGAQDDIFEDSYPGGIPPPSPNSTVVPTPVLNGSGGGFASQAATPAPTSSTISSSPGSQGLSSTAAGSASSLPPVQSPPPTSQATTATASGTPVGGAPNIVSASLSLTKQGPSPTLQGSSATSSTSDGASGLGLTSSLTFTPSPSPNLQGTSATTSNTVSNGSPSDAVTVVSTVVVTSTITVAASIPTSKTRTTSFSTQFVTVTADQPSNTGDVRAAPASGGLPPSSFATASTLVLGRPTATASITPSNISNNSTFDELVAFNSVDNKLLADFNATSTDVDSNTTLASSPLPTSASSRMHSNVCKRGGSTLAKRSLGGYDKRFTAIPGMGKHRLRVHKRSSLWNLFF